MRSEIMAFFLAAVSAAEFTPAQTIPNIKLSGGLTTWIDSLYPARSWHPINSENYAGVAMGLFSGVGSLATVWLPVCQDAGFELPSAAYVAYSVINNPGLTKTEKMILPIPSYIQGLVSFYYIWVCMAKPGMAYVVSDAV